MWASGERGVGITFVFTINVSYIYLLSSIYPPFILYPLYMLHISSRGIYLQEEEEEEEEEEVGIDHVVHISLINYCCDQFD